MKKIFAILTALFTATSVYAGELNLTEGKQYQVIDQPRSAQPEVIEFFSFYCPHCYHFDMDYKIPQQIKQNLPEGVSFKQYHVDFLGGQSENLSRAWALAMAMGVEDKVKDGLFVGAQRNTFKSMADIRQVFIDNGISAEQFDGSINSFAVNNLVNRQAKLAETFKVRGVPDFYVNGKFRVNPEGLSNDNVDTFVSEYVQTVQQLLKK
ncbi:thiol:disulfide interchange protein DsbA [Volucribacter psittacicida]|uniref:Thiol:disulfide interchange protein n=1 Tax=Volucribacter psittacicida TaxID=203482 RepID=A0A4V2PB30_9PAST|nr:DsbA family protein [Volucribacter psittacicida]TCJ95835.1 thiol:disulfide interchange protein DsbA [Volucribacter psittacicida]